MNLVWYRPILEEDTSVPENVTVIRDMALLPAAIEAIIANKVNDPG
jgi:hypothetical protein